MRTGGMSLNMFRKKNPPLSQSDAVSVFRCTCQPGRLGVMLEQRIGSRVRICKHMEDSQLRDHMDTRLILSKIAGIDVFNLNLSQVVRVIHGQSKEYVIEAVPYG